MQARTVQAPQVGFNNNVKHKGRVFHIQTEDSGTSYAHITTHLFADGGRILRSLRTDYSELLGTDDLAAQLRKRMKEQHRAMFVSLREGRFDDLIDEMDNPRPASTSQESQEKAVASVSRPEISSRMGASNPATLRRSDEPESSDGERQSSLRISERAASGASSAGHSALRPSIEERSSSAGSIFGSVNISEQSLDDVILSYISDDLEAEAD